MYFLVFLVIHCFRHILSLFATTISLWIAHLLVGTLLFHGPASISKLIDYEHGNEVCTTFYKCQVENGSAMLIEIAVRLI